MFTLNETGWTITIATQDVSRVGSYFLSYTVSLASYPAVLGARKSNALQVVIEDTCTQILGLEISSTALPGSSTYFYTGDSVSVQAGSAF